MGAVVAEDEVFDSETVELTNEVSIMLESLSDITVAETFKELDDFLIAEEELLVDEEIRLLIEDWLGCLGSAVGCELDALVDKLNT